MSYIQRITSFYKSNSVFIWISSIYLLMIYFFRNLPFFWDMTYISEVADTIFISDFQQFINPAIDNGTPPLFSLMLAILWFVFSKSLWVSHLLTATFVVGFLWQTNRLCHRFLPEKSKIFVLILLFADPVFLTQSILITYDFAILFFTLLAFNSLLENKRWWLVFALLPVPLLNLRGFSFVIMIFLMDFFIHRKNLKIKLLLSYIPAFVIMLSWMVYHRSITGFYVVSPGNNAYHTLVDLQYFGKSFLLALWKVLDFNRFIIILSGVFVWYFQWKRKFGFNLVSIFGIFSFLIFLFVFLLFRYPLSHRYLMLTMFVISFVFVQLLTFYSFSRQILLISFAILLLVIGNFHHYPQKYGNAWDCSLKGINYLHLKRDVLSDLKRNGKNNCTIASFFPEIRDQKYAYLNDEFQMHFVDFKTENLKNVDFVMYSNTFNILPLSLSELENKGFRFYKNYQNGFAKISLYQNISKIN